jgi:TPR repeat protein
MDIFSATLIDTKRYTQEQQPKNQTSILAQRINQIHEGNPSEAQARYAKLFWTAPISLNPVDVKRTAHDSEINIRYACLAKKHDEKVAGFLLGQVFLADDSQHGVVANKEQAIQHLGKAFDQGFQPAEDSLISLYSSAPHVSENGFIDVAPDFAYKVLTQAAQHKSPTAHFLLGAMHLFIDENKGDEDTFDHFALALDHLKVAFNLGHNQWNLADTESEKICERARQ